MFVRALHHWVPLMVVAGLACLPGCASRRPIHDPDYVALEQAVAASYQAADPVRLAQPQPAPQGKPQPRTLAQCLEVALAQSPEIQAAQKKVQSAAYRVPQAASLPDPQLGITTLPEPIQTAAGQQELGLQVGQKFPWPGKLDLRAQVAQAQLEAAQAELVATQLSVIERVKRAYFELYFVQQAIRITEENRKLMEQLLKIADARYRNNQVSQQDVLRAELELSNIDRELIAWRQRLESTRARLAQLMHIDPETPLVAAGKLPPEAIPQDMDQLFRLALARRPELHAQLARIRQGRRQVDLAELDYLPDVTLSVSWLDMARNGISPVANGRDPVLLAASINLPIYRKRLDAAVREAETQTVAAARSYDALRDATLADVADLMAQAQSQMDLLKLFRQEILPKAELTFRVSLEAYPAGQIDFLQLIDNWQQLLRYQLAYERLQAQLRQTLASLERVIGQPELVPAQ